MADRAELEARAAELLRDSRESGFNFSYKLAAARTSPASGAHLRITLHQDVRGIDSHFEIEDAEGMFGVPLAMVQDGAYMTQKRAVEVAANEGLTLSTGQSTSLELPWGSMMKRIIYAAATPLSVNKDGRAFRDLMQSDWRQRRYMLTGIRCLIEGAEQNVVQRWGTPYAPQPQPAQLVGKDGYINKLNDASGTTKIFEESDARRFNAGIRKASGQDGFLWRWDGNGPSSYEGPVVLGLGDGGFVIYAGSGGDGPARGVAVVQKI